VLICKRCVKRCRAGAEIRKALKTELKIRRDLAKPKLGLVTTSCLGVCPKSAVVIAGGSTLRSGDYLLLSGSDGVAAAVEAMLHDQ